MAIQALYEQPWQPLPTTLTPGVVQLVDSLIPGDLLYFWFSEQGGLPGSPISVPATSLIGPPALPIPIVIDSARRAVQEPHIVAQYVNDELLSVWQVGANNINLGLRRIDRVRGALGPQFIGESQVSITTASEFINSGIRGWDAYAWLTLDMGRNSRTTTGNYRLGLIPDTVPLTTVAAAFAALASSNTALDTSSAQTADTTEIDDTADQTVYFFFNVSLGLVGFDPEALGLTRRPNHVDGSNTYLVYRGVSGAGLAALTLNFEPAPTGAYGASAIVNVEKLLGAEAAAEDDAIDADNSILLGRVGRSGVANSTSAVYVGHSTNLDILITATSTVSNFYPLRVYGQ